MEDAGGQTLLVAQVAGHRIGLPAAAIARVRPLPVLHAPPGLPAPIAGFVTEGGQARAVLMLAVLLDASVPRALDLYAHILEPADGSAGLLVDRALGLVAGGPPRPVAAEASFNGMATGIADTDEGPVTLIDPARLLLEAERRRLDVFTAEAQRRLAGWAA